MALVGGGIPQGNDQILKWIEVKTADGMAEVAETYTIEMLLAFDFPPTTEGGDVTKMERTFATKFLANTQRRYHDMLSQRSPPAAVAGVQDKRPNIVRSCYVEMQRVQNLLQAPINYIGFQDKQERTDMLAVHNETGFMDYDRERKNELAHYDPSLIEFLSGPPVSTANLPPYFAKVISDEFENKTRALQLLWIQARIFQHSMRTEGSGLIVSVESIQLSITGKRDALTKRTGQPRDNDRTNDDKPPAKREKKT